MALYGTDVPPFLDPEIPIDIIPTYSNIFQHIPTYSNLRIPYEILEIWNQPIEPTNRTNQSISIVMK